MLRLTPRPDRSIDDLPAEATDEELLAWSRQLLEAAAEPAGKPVPTRPTPPRRPRRTEPLRARPASNRLELDELFDEITERATAAA